MSYIRHGENHEGFTPRRTPIDALPFPAPSAAARAWEGMGWSESLMGITPYGMKDFGYVIHLFMYICIYISIYIYICVYIV